MTAKTAKNAQAGEKPPLAPIPDALREYIERQRAATRSRVAKHRAKKKLERDA